MLSRTMNAARLNELANNPELRPFLGGEDGPLDLTAAAENPANLMLEGQHGAFLLHPVMMGVYELHTLFEPKGRGRQFFNVTAPEMFRFVFTQTEALEIFTKCPDDNAGARMAAALVGFRERFRRPDAWGPGVGVSYRVFSVDDWFIRDDECRREGQAFHAMLEAAKVAIGSTLPVHPEDPAHDHAVGAAVMMWKAGHMEKALAFYNRWAILAGYATIEAVGPNVVDVQDAIVEVRNGQMGVLLCRSEQHSQPPQSEAP